MKCYSCIPDSKDFHKKTDVDDNPFLYCTLSDAHAEKVYFELSSDGNRNIC